MAKKKPLREGSRSRSGGTCAQHDRPRLNALGSAAVISRNAKRVLASRPGRRSRTARNPVDSLFWRGLRTTTQATLPLIELGSGLSYTNLLPAVAPGTPACHCNIEVFL